MSNFNLSRTLVENINNQNDKINNCIDIVNGLAKDEEIKVIQEIRINEELRQQNELVRQQNELVRQEQYNNNENRFTEINQRIETVSEQFNEKLNDINVIPQGQLPAKQGISTNSNKFVLKKTENDYRIVQNTDNGYILYTFKNGEGDNSASSVGGKFDLLRLRKVEQVNEMFLWKEPLPITGTLTKVTEPHISANTIEKNLIPTTVSSSEGNITGLSMYDLAAGESAVFKLKLTKSSKANIVFLSSYSRSANVDLLVNDVAIKNINAKRGFEDGFYCIEEFDIPYKQISAKTINLTVRNNDTKVFSIVCFNLYSLKDYNGADIDSYKIYKNSKSFLSSVGASDYAIRDKELGKWCGSYHGGEVAESQKIKYGNNLKDISTLENETYFVTNDLRIEQLTNINNKAKMISIYDFNIDGTFNMNFSLFDNTIISTDIYTALTCTASNFQKVNYPQSLTINLNDDTPIYSQVGYVEQERDGLMRIGIRYNTFNEHYNKLGKYIRHDSNYSKFYYGVVANYTDGVIIPNLTFSKALDFYNLKF